MELMNQLGELVVDSDELIKMSYTKKCSITSEDLCRRHIERRVLEESYMKTLQLNQVHAQRLEEQARMVEIEKQKQLLNELNELQFGTYMIKLGRSGSPCRRLICLKKELNQYIVTWDSKKKSNTTNYMFLKNCSYYIGMSHGNFLTRSNVCKQYSKYFAFSFSLINETRSLDLICFNQHEFTHWQNCLKRVQMKLNPPQTKREKGEHESESDDEHEHEHEHEHDHDRDSH
jgi:hypothetical protein